MPVVAGITQTDGPSLFVEDMGDHQDFRLIGQQELTQHMNLQRAPVPEELDLLGRCDALIAEHRHMVVQIGAVPPVKVRRGERPAQIQPQQLGTQRRGQSTDLKALRNTGAHRGRGRQAGG